MTKVSRHKLYYEKKKSDPTFKLKRKEEQKRWRAKNREYIRLKSAERHAKHKHDTEYKKQKCQYTLDWYKNNPGKVNAMNARYRGLRLNATPSWLSEEQLTAITLVYENCPKDYHVDHIVPLKGKDVCGLHVPWNLQHLPAVENVRKGNKFNTV